MYGVTLHIQGLINAKELAKKTVWAGGELLERAGIARGPYRGQVMEMLEGAKKGEIIH
jgi:hypothetical protein